VVAWPVRVVAEVEEASVKTGNVHLADEWRFGAAVGGVEVAVEQVEPAYIYHYGQLAHFFG
jgi:hypothetical protein